MYTAGHINYGGRVTDDWDRRCIMTILDDYYNANVFEPKHKYSESGIYKQIDPSCDHEVGFLFFCYQFVNQSFKSSKL